MNQRPAIPSRRTAAQAAGWILFLTAGFFLCFWAASCRTKTTGGNNTAVLLNVSYDATRGLYEAYNAQFVERWRNETGQSVVIEQSHGGSGRQARSVIDGLQADVVTLALSSDIDAIVQQTGAIHSDWQARLPHQSAPYTSTVVFLVRKGNPKAIRDWDDLIRPDVEVTAPNPKTSGGARWLFLAAWAYALETPTAMHAASVNTAHSPVSTEATARAEAYMRAFYANVEVLDAGARGASTTFSRNKLGDVLVTWENEAWLLCDELPLDGFEVIVPSISVLAVPPVSVVDDVVDRRGSRALAEAYLQGLYRPEAQELAATFYYRPSDPEVLARHASRFPAITMRTVEELAGDWGQAHARFFADGGLFDAIMEKQGRGR